MNFTAAIKVGNIILTYVLIILLLIVGYRFITRSKNPRRARNILVTLLLAILFSSPGSPYRGLLLQPFYPTHELGNSTRRICKGKNLSDGKYLCHDCKCPVSADLFIVYHTAKCAFLEPNGIRTGRVELAQCTEFAEYDVDQAKDPYFSHKILTYNSSFEEFLEWLRTLFADRHQESI